MLCISECKHKQHTIEGKSYVCLYVLSWNSLRDVFLSGFLFKYYETKNKTALFNKIVEEPSIEEIKKLWTNSGFQI